MRVLLGSLLIAAVAAAVALGLAQASSQRGVATTGSQVEPSQPAGAPDELPPRLAALNEQAGELLPGDEVTVRRSLRRLQGHPVVINKWASWCEPCRAEAPILQRQGVRHRDRIAFLGVNWRDAPDGARGFLDTYQLPFPSYQDRDGEIARALAMPSAIPATLFLDARGELAYLHQGPYRSDRELADDIARYLPAS